MSNLKSKSNIIKNKLNKKEKVKMYYENCEELYQAYLKLDNSAESYTNNYNVITEKVAGAYGPIIKISFPNAEICGERCNTEKYEGIVANENNDPTYIRVLIEDFYDRNDLWRTGFVKKDDQITPINAANVSSEHENLIREIKKQFKLALDKEQNNTNEM